MHVNSTEFATQETHFTQLYNDLTMLQKTQDKMKIVQNNCQKFAVQHG